MIPAINTIASPKGAFLCQKSKLASLCVILSIKNWPDTRSSS